MLAAKQSPSRWRAGTTVLAMVALLLRLVWGVPQPADPERAIAALFGDHALCLAGADQGGDPTQIPRDDRPGSPIGHGDHDNAGCCKWHAAGGVILADARATTHLAFVERTHRVIAADRPPPERSLGGAQARAPPFRQA